MAESTSQLSILVKVRDEASAALNRLSGDISDMGGSLNWAAGGAGALAGGMAAIAGAQIMNAVKAFADSEVQMARFNAIVKTLPADLQKYRDRMLETADAALKLGFDNEDAAVAIAKLFQATGNADLSFKAFQAAMDLARYKGIGLEEATQALILAFQGGGRMLKQLGIEVDDHASKETILQAVLKATAGQAEAFAETLSGQFAIIQQAVNEMSEALGSVFAPIIKTVLGWIQKWIEYNGGLKATIENLKPIIVAVAAVLAVLLVAGIIAAGFAFAAFIGTAGAVAVGIIALAAVIGVFAIYWKQIWEQLSAFFQIIGERISSIWRSVVNTLRTAFDDAIGWIRSQLQGILDFFRNVVNTVSQPIKAVGNAASSVVGSIKNFFGFAEGGIVTRPTMGLVGEAGPEAIIPLSKLGGMGGGGVNIYLQGDFYTTDEIAERFANTIARTIKLQLRV